MSLLSPAVIAAIDDLELAARVVVEGLQAGGNRSPFHGYGAEFQQYRPYRAGDDLKYLDWKMYARSDRLFTRQFRETMNLSMMIVLDTSASMAYPREGLTKLRYASIVAASLAYLVVEQGNAVGLMTGGGEQLSYLPARTGRSHLRTLLARLENSTATGRWNGAEVITRGAELLRRRGVLLVISDFYDDEGEVRQALRQVLQRGHDVAAVQVTSPSERELPVTGQVELQDLESGERRLVDAGSLALPYADRVREFHEGWRTACADSGIDYALMSIDQPPERTLRDFLIRRSA
jgi:uncharacterized protein (DUF58 family)